MNTLFRIINNQLEIHDSLDSYRSWGNIEEEIYEDEGGKYQIFKVFYEHPCNCHPETCCHEDGKVLREREEKIYLDKTNQNG